MSFFSKKISVNKPLIKHISLTQNNQKIFYKNKQNLQNFHTKLNSKFNNKKIQNFPFCDYLSKNSIFIHGVNPKKNENTINAKQDEEIDSLMSEVNFFLEKNINFKQNKSTSNSDKENSDKETKQKKITFNIEDINLFSNFQDDPEENELNFLNEQIYDYVNDHYSEILSEQIKKFPFEKKLVFLYQYIFYSKIEKLEYKSICMKLFQTEEFDIKNLEDFFKKNLELKIAYYLAFKCVRGITPTFLNENIEAEIIEKISTKNFELFEILIFSKLNSILISKKLTEIICDFLNKIFEHSFSVEKYSSIAEKDHSSIPFFKNLIQVIPMCLKFYNLTITNYEIMFLNILNTVYNLRNYTFQSYDIGNLKLLMNILIEFKKNKNQKIISTEIYKNFNSFVDELLLEYTDNYCTKIIESAQFCHLTILFTKHYMQFKEKEIEENKIKKILDLNLMNLSLLERFNENTLIKIYYAIESFVPFYEKFKITIEENEELKGVVLDIIFGFFKLYSPNMKITEVDMAEADYNSIKNLDVIYLIKLKFLFNANFPRTNEEANSIIIVLKNLIGNSLKNITNHNILYPIMTKCLNYNSIEDSKKIFKCFSDNITKYISDKDFFLFLSNYDLVDKYGDIKRVIKEYNEFVMRQFAKLFQFDEIYYLITRPDKVFHTIMRLCNSTELIEFDNLDKKRKKISSYQKKKRELEDAENLKKNKNFEVGLINNQAMPNEINRFLNVFMQKIKTEQSIFFNFSNRFNNIKSLVYLAFLNDPKLIKDNYFDVFYPLMYEHCINYFKENNYSTGLTNISHIGYYITLIDNNDEMMVYHSKLLAMYLLQAVKIEKDNHKLVGLVKKIERNYLMNPEPFDKLMMNKKKLQYFKLVLRIIKKVLHNN